MGDIRKDIENQAEEAQESSDDQHLGDPMDDADPEAVGSRIGDERDEAERYSFPPEEGDD